MQMYVVWEKQKLRPTLFLVIWSFILIGVGRLAFGSASYKVFKTTSYVRKLRGLYGSTFFS